MVQANEQTSELLIRLTLQRLDFVDNAIGGLEIVGNPWCVDHSFVNPRPDAAIVLQGPRHQIEKFVDIVVFEVTISGNDEEAANGH